MTYSQSVKEELCEAKFHCKQCSVAFVYAMLLFGDRHDDVLFQTDNRKVIALLAQKIVELTGVIASFVNVFPNRKKHPLYELKLEETEDVSVFYTLFDKALKDVVDCSVYQKKCCRASFLRAVFLTCGVIVNPAKEYHFEFKIKQKELANQLSILLVLAGLEFHSVMRKNRYILYLKDSEAIEEILTIMGAHKNALNLMNVKIEKELRNRVNRVTNCETANIQKTVKASMKQVQDIEFIFAKKGRGFLSDDLREIAETRLRCPELSLNELMQEIPFPLSRSGLNHRLNRLCKIAQELRNEDIQ